MDRTGQSLLSKWSLQDPGKKPSLESTKSNLLMNRSSLFSTGLDKKLTISGGGGPVEKKRKQDRAKSSDQNKKIMVETATVKSSRLGPSSLLTQGGLKSSLLGPSSLNSQLTSSTLHKSPSPTPHQLTNSRLQKSLTPTPQTQGTSLTGLSHMTSTTRPLTASLLGSTGTKSSVSLLSKYSSSGLSSNLTAQRSLLGPTTSPGAQKVSGLSPSSVLTDQPSHIGGVSLQTSSLMSTSHLSSKLYSTQVKEKKDSGQRRRKKRSAEEKSDFEIYKVKTPRYDLGEVLPEDDGVEVPKFVNPSKDPSLHRPAIPLHDVNGLKLALVNAVSGSLICQPNFSDSKDLTRRTLAEMSERVVTYDPEFILKVALYTRKDLNIRTTANFLLALASNIDVCRPFLKKYYCSSIQLPSDWIEVAEIYQAFHDTNLSQGSLPAALRKVMILKFQDFDKYQLAKYNKESSMKKKKKKENAASDRGSGLRGRGGGRGARGAIRGARGAIRGARGGRGGAVRPASLHSDSSSDSDSDGSSSDSLEDVVCDEEEHTKEEMEKIKFSIKQLIRKLHVVEPVEHVMSIIGKRYPDTLEGFYKARLPGEWDEERAGKRMKLPVPETWETQVSLKGNKASTWEDLIDHKKLPFMAMLRNLRNLIKAGISQKHHQQILRRLQDERQVANSKQFPFRFFSAYEVLSGLEKEYEETQKKLVEIAEMEAAGIPQPSYTPRGRGRGRGWGRGKGKNWWMDKKNKKDTGKPKETAYDKGIINRYKKALDTAVKIATVYNVQPIRGRTIVLCDCSDQMRVNCTAARGLGKPRQMLEVGLLMGLMCQYSCEECEFITFQENSWQAATVEPGTILNALEHLLEQQENIKLQSGFPGIDGQDKFSNGFPESILTDKLRDRIQLDNLVVLSGGELAQTQQKLLSNFLKKYRQIVNPNLLYVNISFAGKGCGFSQSIKPEHDNDIYISGYSDAILRFIAERGEGGQLIHVEKIDEAFKLKALAGGAAESVIKVASSTPERPLPLLSGKPSWRKTRVFISSTFRDMHGERDVLTRYVFPELRAQGRKHFINIQEVDLRWGITEEESNRAVELCLTEVMKCEFFIGILGNRYGYVPDRYLVPDMEEFDWLKTYPPHASVTELEMHLGALANPSKAVDKAFFYVRDPSFEAKLPSEFHADFLTENSQAKERLEALKTRIFSSSIEVYKGYPCQWGGVSEGRPMVAGLEKFATRVLNNLWNAIQKAYPDEEAVLDENMHVAKQHEAVVEIYKERFVGRKNLIKECMKHITDQKTSLVALNGKPGCGKSALLSALVHNYMDNLEGKGSRSVLVHVVGAAPGSANIVATLRRLCYELRRMFCVETEIPEDFKNLTQKFGELLVEGGSMSASPLVIFIDGLDMMEKSHQPCNLEWLPREIPKNVVFVMTTVDGGKCHSSLKRRLCSEVTVGGLDMFDKAEVVRNNLAVYRKKLDESPFTNQMKFIMGKKDAGNPLFLKLACEELRVFGNFEMVTSKLKSLPQTVSLMLQEVLTRLESDLGQELVALAMTLLVCSRDGLMPEELHDLLSLHALLNKSKFTADDVCNVLLSPDKMLPPAVFSHLRRSLHTFLNPNENAGTCLSLAHMDVAVAVRSRYMKGSGDQETSLHRLMAGYFLQLVDPERNQSYTGNNVRAFSELPYHLAFGGEFKMWGRVVCSLEFISTKCRLGLGSTLLEDYQEKEFSNRSMEREQQRMMGESRFQEYKMFVSRNIHLLDKYPALTWQQAVNDLQGSEPYNDGVTSLDTASDQCDLCFRWSNRPQTQDPNYLTLSNLPQPVLCVAVSPDNEFFVCGGLDCVVHLHQMETGKEVRSFYGHADVISDVCFAGKMYVCSASLDNLISVWNREDGHRVHTLKGHSRRVQSISSDPSGKLVASASWDCTIRVWNIAKGECVCDLKVGSPVNAVSFHPEGQLIVTGQWDSTIKIWDVFHKTRKAVLRGHASSIRDVAYSPCGRYIASAALDGEVKLWESQKGSQVGYVLGHSLPINKLAFSPNGRNLITVSDDRKIKVWSGHLGKPLHCLGKEEDGQVKCVALSPEGETLAVGYHEGDIKFYEVQTGSLIHSSTPHTAAVRRMNFSPCGNFLVTASADCKAKVFRVPTGVLIATMPSISPLMCVTMTKNYIAMGTEDNQCFIFPSVNLKTRVGIQVNVPQATLRGQNGPITSCTFNADASRLATASRDASVFIWDVRQCLLDGKDSQPVQKLHACHADWITDCQWSNVGDFLVTGSVDFNLKIWDIKSGEEKFKLTGHMASITSVRYIYGCIVSSSSDGSVKVWSQKGTEITTLHGHTQCANDAALLVSVSKETTVDEEEDNSDWAAIPKESQPARKRPKVDMESVMVASCSDDGTIRLWNPLQANQLANLTGHDDRVISVASDSHGKLCTSSLDKSVRLWNPTLSSRTNGVCHDAEVTFTCISKDGHCLLTGSRDGYIKLWSVNLDRTNIELTQSLKCHGKSLNAGCFVGHHNQKFVTGGDDAVVLEWKLVEVKGSDSIARFRKLARYEMDSPVTSVLWHDSANVSSGHIIVCAEWERARVSVINTESRTVLKSIQLGSPESGLWVMNLLPLRGTELLALTSDSRVHTLQITGSFAPKGGCDIRTSSKYNIPCRADITEKVPEHKRGLNMVLCGATLGENVRLGDAVTQVHLLGDSKGQLTILTQNSLIASLKIHDREVTSVRVSDDIILTASLDRSVKAWRVDTTRSYTTPLQVLTEGLQQVGQFWCPAPVTSMELAADSSGRELVCGDQLGNVHFFVVQDLH